jgi:hypothetical protein
MMGASTRTWSNEVWNQNAKFKLKNLFYGRIVPVAEKITPTITPALSSINHTK